MPSLPQSPSLALIALALAYAVIQDALFLLCLTSQPSPIIGFFLTLFKLRRGWPYMTQGPEVIFKSYKDAKGQPFVVQTPSNKHVFLSSSTHIRELDLLSSKNLSLHAAAKDILQPRYTYTNHGWEWPDLRGTESLGFNRAVRSLLTNNLVKLTPSLEQTLAGEFKARIASSKEEDGWIKFPVMPNVRWTLMIVNSVLFFGEDFSKDEDFRKAMLNYQDIVPLCAELVKFLPSFTAPLLCRLLTGNYRSYRRIHDTLVSTVEKRMQLRAAGGDTEEKPLDGVQWLIDTSPKPSSKSAWNATRAIDESISTWYTSVPQLSAITSFAVHDLAIYPDWQEKLISELRGGGYEAFLKTGQGLPLMESFIKESARFNPIDGVVCRRKVIAGPVEFSKGPKVQQGDWVSVPQQAMWRDENIFHNPDEFDPMRFLMSGSGSNAVDSHRDGELGLKPDFTEVSPTWVLWGFGRTAW